MALDGTYAGLQASIADWLVRSDLAATAPDLIALAEAKLNRRLTCRDMWVATELSLTASTLAVPADLSAVESLQITDPTGHTIKPRYISPQMMDRRQLSAIGVPHEYTITGGTFVFWPTPVAPDGTQLTLPLQLRYRQRLPALATAEGNTNWLLTKHPDAYLWASLMAAAPYLKDDDRLETWGNLLEAAIQEIEADDARVASDSLQMHSGLTDRGHSIEIAPGAAAY